ncbi:ribosome biogenesis GTPase YqeH [Haliovirga abyssi]|uniref:Ribosome biogenesis GTPase YqeH n=1 Tax=Haliovirga abyssi TaxID=2996794 RepID=A0AAU9DIP3_9FUSO|nr:ribosome biogenesis GTPase YqeH [Haliovirga abyssi]
MNKKKCNGCGAELQSNDENRAGYVPKDKLKKTGNVVCKRCFQITNYGKYVPVGIADEEYIEEVKMIIKELDVVILILDIIDFEGSFNEKILNIIRDKPIIVAINKIDLVPTDKHPSEISDWVKKRFIEKRINPLDISIISAKTRYGVNGILTKLNHFYKGRTNVGVVGVTNVGKSTVINRLLGNKKNLTVSKYPGTTLKIVKNIIPGTEFTLIDTPGIIPNGRISDMVCHECNLKIVPSSEISRMTFKMEKDRVLMLGGLAVIRVLNEEGEKPIFAAFASKDVKFHKTNINRIEDMKSKHIGEMLIPPCNNCKDEYSSLKMKKEVHTVNEGEELVLKGLGWLSVKRGPLKVEVELPENAEIIIRKAFIVPRR